MSIEHYFKYLKSLSEYQIEEILTDFYKSIENKKLPNFHYKKWITVGVNNISLCSESCNKFGVLEIYHIVLIGYDRIKGDYHLDCDKFLDPEYKENNKEHIRLLNSIIRKYKIENI